jgi:multiple sugar transport system substrate-binding protein
MAATILNGITWGHSRGITPLLAASQRYSELYPDVEIRWAKRSLQEFADYPIEKLTKNYDLLVIDHPWVGRAAATGCVLPLEEHLGADFLRDQAENTVGHSHESYQFEGHQWGLAIDAATPAASYRQDLLTRQNVAIPQTWEELISLAKTGRVALPAIPIDLLMNFYTFCIVHGREPFLDENEVIDKATGLKAIATMRELYSLVDKKMFECNPIAVAELMTSTDDYWYCPFAYCYSNYSRTGYSKYLLEYTDVVRYDDIKLRTTIGGTGLAVSAFGKHHAVALDFADMVASPVIQQSFYVQHGGQPGHRSAWISKNANELTHDFFTNLLPVMDNGYLRPRYNGYLHFQDHAGLPLQQCIMEQVEPEEALAEMNRIYQQSLIHKNTSVKP